MPELSSSATRWGVWSPAWYLEKCGGADVTRKLITLGTPWRGATDALEQLVNGVKKGLGPLSIDLTAFSRSMPSLHQLLPEYACIADGRGGFAKTTEVLVPNLDTAMVADAMTFHTDLQAAEAARPGSLETAHMVIGIRQPTRTTVTFRDGTAVTSETFGADNDYGDGTVTLTGAVGLGESLDTNRAVRVPDQHANLQCNQFVLDQVQEILTAKPVRRRDLTSITVRAKVPDLVVAGHRLDVTFDLEGDDGQVAPSAPTKVTVRTGKGRVLATAAPILREGHGKATFTDLPPGAHTVTVAGVGAESPVRPVVSTVLIWPSHERA